MDKEDIQPCQGCSTACLGCVTLLSNLIFPGVKSKVDIISEMASERMVEAMVENIAHQSMTADLKDLSQMVYMILLEYDETKIQELWTNHQMSYFLARIIINQYRSSNSPFHALFRKYQHMIDNDLHISPGLSDDGIDVQETLNTIKVIRYGKGD